MKVGSWLAVLASVPGCSLFLSSDPPGPVDETFAVDQRCAPVPLPGPPAISLGPGDDIVARLQNASASDTFVLEPGTYPITETIPINVPGVTLIGADRDTTRLEASGPFAVFTATAEGFTLANVTVSGGLVSVLYEPAGTAEINGARIEYTVLERVTSRPIEIRTGAEGGSIAGGQIRCNKLIHDPDSCARSSLDNRGIFADPGPAWQVSFNEFRGFACPGVAVTAIAFKRGDGVVIDNNLFFEGAAAIFLGVNEPRACDSTGIGTAVICNNLIDSRPEPAQGSIGLNAACDATIAHNSIAVRDAGLAIELRGENSGTLANNASNASAGPGIAESFAADANAFDPQVEFTDVGRLDLRLRSANGVSPAPIVKAATRLQACDEDFLGTPRDFASPVAIGALESPVP